MAVPTTPSLHAESYEEQTLQVFLRAARLLSKELSQELRREIGMGQVHYEILGWLEEAPEHRMAMGDLARRSAVSPSGLTHLVGRLETLSWVRRLHSPQDGRCHFAELTDAGRAALQEATPRHLRYAKERVLDRLSAEQVSQLREISEILLRQPSRRSVPSDSADTSGQSCGSDVAAVH